MEFVTIWLYVLIKDSQIMVKSASSTLQKWKESVGIINIWSYGIFYV